jgi:hypothetical protein
MKCNETQGKWCKNKHGASKIIDTFETYQYAAIAIMAASLVLGSNSTSLNSASKFLTMLRAAPSGGMCDRALC